MAGRVQQFIVGKQGLRYLVLAERNCANLADGVASLWSAWTSLRRSVHWKRKVRGSIAVLEVTYNRDSQTWHPHLNVLMEGEYFPFEQLNLLWQHVTAGNGRTSYIRAADESTVYELIKYTLKVAERAQEETGVSSLRLIIDRPAAIDELLSALYGARLIRTYGTFYGLNVTDQDEPQEECPDCGSKKVCDLGPVSDHQLFFDFEKEVFRVRDDVALKRANYSVTWEKQQPAKVVAKPGTRQNQIAYFHNGADGSFSNRLRVGDQVNGVTLRISDRREKIFQAVQSRKQQRMYERAVCGRFRSPHAA